MKVLIVCAGGMSSAIVLKAIQLEAEKQGLPLTLKAIGAHELENELPDYDMALVAPQIRHRFVSLSDIGKSSIKRCNSSLPRDIRRWEPRV